MLFESTICPQHIIMSQVTNSFMEDMLIYPDWTASLIPSNKIVTSIIKTNEYMVLCGKEWAESAFRLYDKEVKIKWNFNDGDKVQANSELCSIHGYARSQLSAERTALNFLQLLSGTATTVANYVSLVHDTKVKIMDTRKTICGLRLAQKYAVHVGGGINQRSGLYDGVLIKENHIIAHGGIKQVLQSAFATIPSHIPIQIEVENFAQLKDALKFGAKLILLDNMDLQEIRKCVKYTNQEAELEVSGNISLDNIRDYALTGIDRISVGALTKNVKVIDLSMRFIGTI